MREMKLHFMKFEDFQGIEATYLDYKVSLEKEKPKSWLKTVVAFANTRGGHILFGVTNNEHAPIGLDAVSYTHLDVYKRQI